MLRGRQGNPDTVGMEHAACPAGVRVRVARVTVCSPVNLGRVNPLGKERFPN